MVLSQFVPWLLTPILMVGGAYLAYEGAAKVWEIVSGHREEEAEVGQVDEKAVVSGAIRTDFILSAEIMVIALNEVDTEPFVSRLIILVIVALLITALVYGVVGLIVKMDDVGLHLAGRESGASQRVGRGLVKGMPKLLSVLSTVGIAAMLWVGGHILLVGVDELGWHALYDLVHHLEEVVAGVAGIGGLLAWVVDTLASALIGLVVGAIIVAVLHVIPRRRKHDGAAAAH
jgi:predicted DNA repair protein MutK